MSRQVFRGGNFSSRRDSSISRTLQANTGPHISRFFEDPPAAAITPNGKETLADVVGECSGNYPVRGQENQIIDR